MTETSSEFNSAFSGVGSIVMECGCGRTYFVSDGDYDDGEFEELRAKSAKRPEAFIEDHASGFISGIGIPGFGVIVRGCVCGMDVAVETFLDERKSEILDYYRRILAAKASKAETLRRGLQSLEPPR